MTTTPTLNSHEIAELVGQAIFTMEGLWEGETNSRRLSGLLSDGSRAYVEVQPIRGLINVFVTTRTPKLSFGFHLFSEDATAERVKRFADHFAELQRAVMVP